MNHPGRNADDIPSGRARQYAPWLSAAFLLLFVAALDPVFGAGIGWPRAACLLAGMAVAVPGLRHLLRDGRIQAINRRRWLAALAGIHLLATLQFFPPAHLFDDRPILTDDHAVHFVQCVRARAVFREHLRLDCYSPYFMAGYPAGTVFDIDMKGAELVAALAPVPAATALKCFILFAYLTLLPAAYRAARMLGLRVEESALGAMVLLAYWHWGRPYAGDFRFAGMFSFVFATHAVLYLTGLLRRFLDGERARTFFVLGPVTFLVHVLTVVLAAVPMLAVLVADRRSLTRRRVELLFLWVLAVVAVNALWIVPLARFLPDKVPTEVYYQLDGPAALARLVVEPGGAIALAVCGLALAGVWRLRRDRRWAAALPFAAGATAMLAIAVFGVRVPGVDQLEPGRFLFSALVFACPLAGAGLAAVIGAVARRAPDGWERRTREAAIIALALAPLPLAMLDAKAFYRRTLSIELPPRVELMRARIAASVHPGARLMIEEGSAAAWEGTFLPVLLPAQTGVEQIGGPFPHTPLIHHRTTFDSVSCLGTRFAQWDVTELERRLRFLRVRWIATSTAGAGRFIAGIPGVRERWRDGEYVFWEIEGMDALDEMGATYDEIRVAAPVGGAPRVIPYHWVEGLRASDGNEIVPVLRDDDPVPFVCLRRVRVSPVVIRY